MNDDELIKGFIPSLKSFINDSIYDIKQKFVLYRAIITNLDLGNIANPDIPAKEMESLLDEQQEMAANLQENHNLDPTKYDLKQLQELDRALKGGLDISHYKDPAFSADQMYLATTFQEGGIDQMERITPEMSKDEILNLRTERIMMANGISNKPNLNQMDSEAGLSLTELQNLINNGADVNEPLHNQSMPLLMSVWNDKPAEALLLLRNGADANAVDITVDINNEMPALSLVRSPEMAKILLEHGANIEAIDEYEATALINSCYPIEGNNLEFENRFEVTNVLLENGANPNLIDHFGETALHKLTPFDPRDIEIAKKLIEHGANPEILDKYGGLPKIMELPELKEFMAIQNDIPPWENSKFYKFQNHENNYVMSDKETGKHIFVSSNDEVMRLLEKHDPDGIINELRNTGKLELSNGETLDLSVDNPDRVGEALAEELDLPHITVEDKHQAMSKNHDEMEID